MSTRRISSTANRLCWPSLVSDLIGHNQFLQCLLLSLEITSTQSSNICLPYLKSSQYSY